MSTLHSYEQLGSRVRAGMELVWDFWRELSGPQDTFGLKRWLIFSPARLVKWEIIIGSRTFKLFNSSCFHEEVLLWPNWPKYVITNGKFKHYYCSCCSGHCWSGASSKPGPLAQMKFVSLLKDENASFFPKTETVTLWIRDKRWRKKKFDAPFVTSHNKTNQRC